MDTGIASISNHSSSNKRTVRVNMETVDDDVIIIADMKDFKRKNVPQQQRHSVLKSPSNSSSMFQSSPTTFRPPSMFSTPSSSVFQSLLPQTNYDYSMMGQGIGSYHYPPQYPQPYSPYTHHSSSSGPWTYPHNSNPFPLQSYSHWSSSYYGHGHQLMHPHPFNVRYAFSPSSNNPLSVPSPLKEVKRNNPSSAGPVNSKQRKVVLVNSQPPKTFDDCSSSTDETLNEKLVQLKNLEKNQEKQTRKVSFSTEKDDIFLINNNSVEEDKVGDINFPVITENEARVALSALIQSQVIQPSTAMDKEMSTKSTDKIGTRVTPDREAKSTQEKPSEADIQTRQIEQIKSPVVVLDRHWKKSIVKTSGDVTEDEMIEQPKSGKSDPTEIDHRDTNLNKKENSGDNFSHDDKTGHGSSSIESDDSTNNVTVIENPNWKEKEEEGELEIIISICNELPKKEAQNPITGCKNNNNNAISTNNKISKPTVGRHFSLPAIVTRSTCGFKNYHNNSI